MNEKRQHNRHNYKEEVLFDFVYDFQAKIDFEPHKVPPPRKLAYHGTTANVSTEGLCFISKHELHIGDMLDINVFVPGTDKPVHLQGEVRWNRVMDDKDSDDKQFNTGIQLTFIGDKNVKESIYYDAQYKIYWSDVLESLLGTFRIIQQEQNSE